MDEFNVVPFLIGLVVAAGLGALSGLVAGRSHPRRPVPVNPVSQDAGAVPAILFWLGFVIAVLGGLYDISSRSAWKGILLYLLIAAIAAAAVSLPARALRTRHNRALDGVPVDDVDAE